MGIGVLGDESESDSGVLKKKLLRRRESDEVAGSDVSELELRVGRVEDDVDKNGDGNERE